MMIVMNKIEVLFLLVAIFYSNLHSPTFTHQFIQTARNTEYGSASDVIVGQDGTIFLADNFGGLIAYI
jgi:hypothetical protein